MYKSLVTKRRRSRVYTSVSQKCRYGEHYYHLTLIGPQARTAGLQCKQIAYLLRCSSSIPRLSSYYILYFSLPPPLAFVRTREPTSTHQPRGLRLTRPIVQSTNAPKEMFFRIIAGFILVFFKGISLRIFT